MGSDLWRGTWATKARIVSGLILMVYVTAHLLNLASVLISPDAYDIVQGARLWVKTGHLSRLVAG